MPVLRQNNIKKKKESLQDWSNAHRNSVVVFLFLRTCHWCEVVFVLHSRWLGTSLSGTVQVIYSGQRTGGGTRLCLFFFAFWLSMFVLHQGHRVWGNTEGEEVKLKGKRMCRRKWKLNSPGNSVQNSTFWRSSFSAGIAQESSLLLVQPPVPCSKLLGYLEAAEAYALCWFAACEPFSD